MKPLWVPDRVVSQEFTADGKTTVPASAFPITESPGTSGDDILTAPVVWSGARHSAADFQGRDVKGKTVMIYSLATPGGRDHSADWSGAIRRANDAGAAVILVRDGISSGNAQSEPGGRGRHQCADRHHHARRRQPDPRSARRGSAGVVPPGGFATEEREGLKSGNVWGALPGASDEQILVMAHTDAFFEGAMDNASGLAMMLDIARHHAAVPQAQRPRTLVFLTTPDHHHGSEGIHWVRDNYDWGKVALIVNAEHPPRSLLVPASTPA